MQNHHVQVFFYHSFCIIRLFLFFLESSFTIFLVFLFVFDFVTIVEAFICELIARFPISHLMDAMGICYLQYWL